MCQGLSYVRVEAEGAKAGRVTLQISRKTSCATQGRGGRGRHRMPQQVSGTKKQPATLVQTALIDATVSLLPQGVILMVTRMSLHLPPKLPRHKAEAESDTPRPRSRPHTARSTPAGHSWRPNENKHASPARRQWLQQHDKTIVFNFPNLPTFWEKATGNKCL